MSHDFERYIILPDSLWKHSDIALSDIKIYGIINRLKNGLGTSYSKLANWSGVSKRTVERSVPKLIELGFLYQKNGWIYIAKKQEVADMDGGINDTDGGQSPTSMAVKHRQGWRSTTDKDGGSLININTNTRTNTRTNNKTNFDINNSITQEQYQAILSDSELAEGDKDYLKTCALNMGDHFRGKGEMKVDWNATLRNWIRNNRSYGKLPNQQKQVRGYKGKPTNFERNMAILEES